MTIRVSVGDNTRASALFKEQAQAAAAASAQSEQDAATRVTLATQQAERAEDEADRAGVEADRSTDAAMEVVAPIKASLSTPQAGEAGVATLAAGARSYGDKLVADAPITGPGRITGFDTWCFVEGGQVEFVLYRDNEDGTFSEVGRRTESTTGQGAACSIVFDVPVEFGDYPVRTAYREVDENALSALEQAGNFKIVGPGVFPASFATADTGASPVRAMVQTQYEQDVQTVTAPAVSSLDQRLLVVEALSAPDPLDIPQPIEPRRIRRAAYDGEPRQYAQTDPITVSTTTNATITGGTVYPRTTDKVAFLGGNWILGTSYPGELYRYNQSVYYGPGEGQGYVGRNPMIEMVVTGSAVEFATQGGAKPFWISIDGVFTNANGYTLSNTDGEPKYVKLAFATPLDQARVKIYFAAGVNYGETRVPAGAFLSDPAPVYSASAIWIGDSITEGTQVSHEFKTFPAIASGRLGVRDYVASGVGATGYVVAPEGRVTFIERINDVLQGIDGGPPDLCVLCGGLNDPYSTQAEQDAFDAAVLDYVTALRAGAPNMTIIGYGPMPTQNGYDPRLSGQEASVHAVMDLFPNCFKASVSDAANHPDWTSWFGLDSNGQFDGTHVMDPGHAHLGELMGEDVKAILL
ncbi:SGNH/GDSL hydrolase family protein [Croceicoccus sp. YJ47]|uniref:SGNH/GDSL hydrolase family protein n=1 Tax=Croceicoccus sp. YJ47 TaxID=2798724 RepID=UPI00192248E1|nr:SGNH/GDSL hydrolase family protein [Croceicoccus sp. YJ47]QQN73962.1 SGNH/GDSL hydrolase family protein [Croceicoccus sp. YJ47]